MLTFTPDAAERVKREMASRLLRAAIFFQTQQMQRLNRSNPRPYKEPSVAGEYPRKRTGAGQAGVVYAPLTIDGIIAAGLRVRLGQTRNSWYILMLEIFRDRLGYRKTLEDLRPQIAAILRMPGGPSVAG